MPTFRRHRVATVALLAVAAATGESPPVPSTAKSTAEIAAALEKVKGFGNVETADFRSNGSRFFAAWYCPFSGIGDCYLHAFYFDFSKHVWTQFIDRLVPSGGDLSVELPANRGVIVFRDTDDKVVVTESIQNLQGQEEPPTTQR